MKTSDIQVGGIYRRGAHRVKVLSRISRVRDDEEGLVQTNKWRVELQGQKIPERATLSSDQIEYVAGVSPETQAHELTRLRAMERAANLWLKHDWLPFESAAFVTSVLNHVLKGKGPEWYLVPQENTHAPE